MTVCYWCGAKDTLVDVGKELDDGKYKMVQCSKCKNAYYVVNKEKMNKQKPQTNEEWFCQLTTEEKARWLYSHYVNARAEEFYGREDEKTLYDYQKWLVSEHRGIDGTKID